MEARFSFVSQPKIERKRSANSDVLHELDVDVPHAVGHLLFSSAVVFDFVSIFSCSSL